MGDSQRPKSPGLTILGSVLLAIGTIILMFIVGLAGQTGSFFGLILIVTGVVWLPLIIGGLALIRAGSGSSTAKTIVVPNPGVATSVESTPVVDPATPGSSPLSVTPGSPASSGNNEGVVTTADGGFCQACGSGTGGSDRFCRSCGAALA